MSRLLLDALPLHHIDTSILMEPVTTEDGRACRKYLQRVGQKYRGQLSLPVLGELMLALLKPISYNDRHDFIEWLIHTKRVRKIAEFVPARLAPGIAAVQRIDKRLDPTDCQIVACASEAQARVLVTLDRVLLTSRKLQEKLNLRILHPRELA